MGSQEPTVQSRGISASESTKNVPTQDSQYLHTHSRALPEWSSETRHSHPDFSSNVPVEADGKSDPGSVFKELLLSAYHHVHLTGTKSAALHCRRAHMNTSVPVLWEVPKPTGSSLAATHQAVLSLEGSDSLHMVVLKLLICTSSTRQFFFYHFLAVLIIILTF